LGRTAAIIDSETPDEERLEALKAMFYAVNKFNATDAQRILGYQLFQIAKKLGSNDLLVLKRVNELRLSTSLSGNSYKEWVQVISAYSSGLLAGLIDLADTTLVQYRLLSERFEAGPAGGRPKPLIDQSNFRLTDLGINFCQNIQTYQMDKKA
jgi:hypothetical protein